jgi:SAM-dependent methyltransferase
MAVAPIIDLEAARGRHQRTWASGDSAEVGTLIVPIAERLADAADLRAGSTLLDVACGSGNMAIAAARLGCVVTGVDDVGSVLERAEKRAAVERLDVAFAWGDAEELPFRDASFDTAASVMGSMFAPHHDRAASELLRVTRPGGTIALASWTPIGFIGGMFWTIAEHMPPPAGVPSPVLWGTTEYLAELFGPDVSWSHHRRTFTFRFRSVDGFVELVARSCGATAEAMEEARCDRDALGSDLRDLAVMWNRLGGEGPIAVPATYLESIGVVR